MKFKAGNVVTHVKTGHRYIVRSSNAKMEHDGTRVCIYEDLLFPCTIWVRPADEFEDGRFVIYNGSGETNESR